MDSPIESHTSPNGLAYEIVLKPAAGNVPRPSLTPTRPSPSSLKREDLEQKLRKASEMRKTQQDEAWLKMQEKQAKIDQIKREAEQVQAHIKEISERKIKTSTEVREAKLDATVARLQAHDKKVEDARQFKEKVVNEKIVVSEEKLIKKLLTAEQNREMIMKDKLSKLQAHDAKVKEALLKKRDGQTA